MKNSFKNVSFGVLALSVTALPAWALSIANPGFETGDLSGWTLSADLPGTFATVVSGFTAQGGGDGRVYLPQEGSYFAVLSGGGKLTPAYTTLTQTFHMDIGDRLDGWAAFDARDQVPFNDNAAVAIQVVSNGSLTPLYSKSVAQVGDYGSSPWETWSFTAASAGDYTLALGVRNIGDNLLNSRAIFDHSFTPHLVSDLGSTILLMGFGLTGVAGFRRKFGQN